MEDILVKQEPRKKGGHLLRNLLIIIVVLAIGFVCLAYFGKYDEGIRAGNVVRVSMKGVIFKTYEGQLNLQSFGALKGASPFAETFEFSVEKSRPDVVKDLEAAALTGERVNLHYIKRYMKFPWRGKTLYFVTEVERMKEIQ